MQAKHGKKGGKATFEKYGRERMVMLGKKSAKKRKANKKKK